MNELEESDLSNCTKCYFNRAVIAILEPLPFIWWSCASSFDESLYIFEREYDYAASFKVISDALEMVEAGVTDRFVTSYEKLGSKFA